MSSFLFEIHHFTVSYHKIPTNVKYIRAILLLIMYCLCIYVYVYMCVHSTWNLLFRINIHCGRQIWSLSDESRCFCISCNNVLILSKYNVHGFFAGLPRNNETRVKTGNHKNGLERYNVLIQNGNVLIQKIVKGSHVYKAEEKK